MDKSICFKIEPTCGRVTEDGLITYKDSVYTVWDLDKDAVILKTCDFYHSLVCYSELMHYKFNNIL